MSISIYQSDLQMTVYRERNQRVIPQTIKGEEFYIMHILRRFCAAGLALVLSAGMLTAPAAAENTGDLNGDEIGRASCRERV